MDFLDKIQKTLEKKDFFWTIRIENREKTNMLSLNEHMKESHFVNAKGIAITLNDFKTRKFISKSIDKEFDVNKLIQEIEYSSNKLKPIKKEEYLYKLATKKDFKSNMDIDPKNIDFSDKQNFVLSSSKELKKENHNSQVLYSEGRINKTIINSFGTNSNIFQNYMLINAHLDTKNSKTGLRESATSRRAFQSGYEIINSFNELKEDVNKNLKDLLEAKNVKGGYYPVVVNGELTEIFMHEAVGHASEADIVNVGGSCLQNKLGKNIAPEELTLHDNSKEEDLWGSFPIDDDGFLAQDTKIIEKGVMSNYLTNLDTISKFKEKNIDLNLSSNSRAQDFFNPTIVRMSNTYTSLGNYSNEELIEDVKKGYLLKGSFGGQVDPGKGQFQFSTAIGYYVENGKIMYPIKNASIGGNTLDILKDIQAIGNQYESGSAGFCGKGGQSVPVIGNNPRMKIKKALIG